MANRILRIPVVIERTGLSRAAIYKSMAEENFPRNIPIGRRAVGWLEADIEEWILRSKKRSLGIPATVGTQK